MSSGLKKLTLGTGVIKNTKARGILWTKFVHRLVCPTVPQSRIMAICDQLRELGSEVVELSRVVNENRNKYFGEQDVSADKERTGDGIISNIEWMISDIKQMVLDVRYYVRVL